MDYKTFSSALPEMLLAATQVLRLLKACTIDDERDRTGFLEAQERVQRKIDELQESYNDGATDLNEANFAVLSEIDEQLSFVLHFARAAVDYRTFLYYKNYQCTLHFEVARALGKIDPVERS